MVESGPAAGALAASFYAEVLGLDRLLSFDMGGTTAKACIIEDRTPLVVGNFEVDRIYRFKSGSGLPILIPSVDMIEIGAGGGSIASVSDLGLLKVGPQSAGSTPGPVCYGRGGTSPCVTDADLVLGYLSADNFLGGDMKLDLAGAQKQLGELAKKLGTSVSEAASGIYRVVGESMTAAARAHAIDRGIDYRGLPLFAFGGAGPVHACYVAGLLESPVVIYPPLASVLSAFGTLVTPPRLDLGRGALARLSSLDWTHVKSVLTELETDARGGLASAGCKPADITLRFGADMRYFGQQNEVTTWCDADPRDRPTSRGCGRLFETDIRQALSPEASRRGRRGGELAPDRHRPVREPRQRRRFGRRSRKGEDLAQGALQRCRCRHAGLSAPGTRAGSGHRGACHHRGTRDHHHHPAGLDRDGARDRQHHGHEG